MRRKRKRVSFLSCQTIDVLSADSHFARLYSRPWTPRTVYLFLRFSRIGCNKKGKQCLFSFTILYTYLFCKKQTFMATPTSARIDPRGTRAKQSTKVERDRKRERETERGGQRTLRTSYATPARAKQRRAHAGVAPLAKRLGQKAGLAPSLPIYGAVTLCPAAEKRRERENNGNRSVMNVEERLLRFITSTRSV